MNRNYYVCEFRNFQAVDVLFYDFFVSIFSKRAPGLFTSLKSSSFPVVFHVHSFQHTDKQFKQSAFYATRTRVASYLYERHCLVEFSNNLACLNLNTNFQTSFYCSTSIGLPFKSHRNDSLQSNLLLFSV